MIYRKNLFEAFLLVSLVIKGTLVTGGPGTSAADAQRIALIKSMAANYHRSFIPEPFLVHQSTHRGNDDDKELYNNCYCGADAVITTSRAEGFGYSLIEPWFHGIAVVGRMPLGTSLLPGMSIPSLYHRLPVPAEWISIRDCYDLYSTSYHRAFAMKFASLQSFVAEYIIDNTIDFGILDERNQMAVIDRLCRNEQDLETFRSYLKKDTIGWPGLGALLSVDITSIRKNKLAVSLWGRSGFAVLFEKWLKTSQIVPGLRAWHRMLLRHFSLINNFRLNSIDR